MAKTPALSTQLKAAHAEIEKLKKDVVNAKSTSDYNSNAYTVANAQIEQINQVLDAVPNPIARESEGENSWDRVKRTALTRLAAWLATRQ